MGMVYNQAFTGCFCSCHQKSLCRNTSYQQNIQMSHKSQLTGINGNTNSFSNNGYPGFQLPPNAFIP